MPVIDAFLRQTTDDLTAFPETTDMMALVANANGGAA